MTGVQLRAQTGDGPDADAGQVDLGILAGRPTVRPTRIDTPPDIDGKLDDDVWRTAAHLTEFTQQQPLDGAPASEATDVYIAYDTNRLYLGFHVHYEDPGIMRANRLDRDRTFADDLVTVYFDTFLDQQRAYSFDVNGYGVQGDGIINTSRGGSGPRGIPFPDRSWDALFDTAARIVDDGYVAEMSIPFKSLRYPGRSGDVEHRWGFQIVREVKQKNEENIVWAPMTRDVQSFMAQMGVLEGMTGLSTSRNLEILPTFTAIRFGSLDGTTGDFTDLDVSPEAGVNLKYGITSNLTADFTLNPDFSQIESDQPQITANQRFPLFFPELRPFFLEGQEIFSFTSPVNLVNTRTIVDPRYGGKLTGKVGKTTLGVIVADDAAPGRRDDPSDPGFDTTAQFLIGRARYDLFTESHIGVVVTDREFLDSYSRVAGVDGQFRLGRADRLNFVLVQSDTRREDGEELSGPMWGTLYRHNGRHLGVTAFNGWTHPGFRTDVGFVRRVDTRRALANVSYRWWPENWLINWGPQFNYERNYNFDGDLDDEIAGGGLNFSFARNVGLGLQTTRALERFGGVDFWKWNHSLFANMNTSRLFSLEMNYRWGDQIFFSDNPFLGDGTQGGVNVTLRPLARLQSQLNFSSSRFTVPELDGLELFDVKIFRAFTTYQWTDRLQLRNITEYNTFSTALGFNLLVTYRVNAGTVFFIGYDDHYQQAGRLFDENDRNGDGLPDPGFDPNRFEQTNRAFFMKFQYLFRY